MAIKIRAVKFVNVEEAVGVMLDSLKAKGKFWFSICYDDNRPKDSNFSNLIVLKAGTELTEDVRNEINEREFNLFKKTYGIHNKWNIVCDDADTDLYCIGTDEYALLKDKGLIADEKELEIGKSYALEHDRKIKCWQLKDGEVGDEAYFRYNGHVVKKGEEVKLLDDYNEYVLIKIDDEEVEIYVPEFEFEHYKEAGGHYGNYFDLIYG